MDNFFEQLQRQSQQAQSEMRAQELQHIQTSLNSASLKGKFAWVVTSDIPLDELSRHFGPKFIIGERVSPLVSPPSRSVAFDWSIKK